MSSTWQQTMIDTPHGRHKGIAPVIISASRSTDIPAFYGQWFMNRLQAGYVKWNNPFNASHPQYVSFDQTRVIVFWTKNAAPFERYLEQLDSLGLHYYFTFTVNDYEEEGFEPGVPPLGERIASFQRLSQRLGRERVIWRYDPLILTDELTVSALLARVKRVGHELAPYTDKLVFSFADIDGYGKVKRNMTACGVKWRTFGTDDRMTFAARLAEMNIAWQLELATCGEEINLRQFGIQHNSCVDGDLMLRMFPHDNQLRKFLTSHSSAPAAPLSLFAGNIDEEASLSVNATHKDKGQRQSCRCVISKDVGQYNTCPHHCVYCYANFSASIVAANYARANKTKNSESIVPALAK